MAKPSQLRTSSLYSVHPGVAMAQTWAAELPKKSGKSFDQWLAAVRKRPITDQAQARTWLKTQPGLTTHIATWLAKSALGTDTGLADADPENYLAMAPRYVDQMFAGPKAALRPLYDQLLILALKLGKDTRACPCTTIVPIYRNHVFAQLKPSTRTRLDLGLALAKHPKTIKNTLPKRLINTGGLAKKDRITHRIAIEHEADIDAFVSKWLANAYQLG